MMRIQPIGIRVDVALLLSPLLHWIRRICEFVSTIETGYMRLRFQSARIRVTVRAYAWFGCTWSRNIS